MKPSKIRAKIERKNAERRRIWAEPGSAPGRAAQIADELDDLYSELRTAEARSGNGDREVIVKRARVERELEKLYGN